MSFIEIAIFSIIGVLAGFSGGLFGIGGGLIAVPCLLLTFHYLGFPSAHAMQMALGTSLGAMVFTAGSSAWAHYRQKGVLWDLFRSLAPGIVIGAILGALIADFLPSRLLAIIFGVFTVLIGSYFLLPDVFFKNQNHLNQPGICGMRTISIIIGALSSILGIGGGIITVPVLTAFGIPIKNAISTSAATGFLIAIVGALSFLFFGLNQDSHSGAVGYVYLPAFFFIGLTSSILAPWGAKLAYLLPTHILTNVFGCFLIIVGIVMVYPR
jgi:uncharacterized protein